MKSFKIFCFIKSVETVGVVMNTKYLSKIEMQLAMDSAYPFGRAGY